MQTATERLQRYCDPFLASLGNKKAKQRIKAQFYAQKARKKTESYRNSLMGKEQGGKHPLAERQDLRDLTEAIQLDRENPSYFFERGKAQLFIYRDYNAALEDFSKAIELQPCDIAYAARGASYELLENYVQAYQDYTTAKTRCSTRKRTGIFQGALQRMVKALQENPTGITANRILHKHFPQEVCYLVNLGRFAYEALEFDQAKVYFTRALQKEPGNEVVHRYLQKIQNQYRGYQFHEKGKKYFSLQEYDKAAEAFSQAVARSPHQAQYLHNLALTYLMQKKYKKVLKPLEEALRLEPHAQRYYDLGCAYQKLCQRNKALENFTKAVEMDSRNVKYRTRQNELRCVLEQPSLAQRKRRFYQDFEEEFVPRRRRATPAAR